MHVVLLSHEYPPFIYGGVGTFVGNLAKSLRRRGAKVTVIAGYPIPRQGFVESEFGQNGKEKDINVIRFPYLNLSPRQIWFQALNFKTLSKTLEGLNPDVIHGQSSSTFPLILHLKKIAPTVVTFHTDPKMELDLSLYSLTRGGSFVDFRTYALGYPVWAYGFKKEFEMSDAAVSVSRALMEQLVLNMGAKNQGRSLCIHNGIDIDALEIETSHFVSNQEEKEPIILFAGRLFWRKGVLYIVRLAYLLEKKYKLKLKIVIHGTGPLHNEIKRDILEYGLTNIVLRGFTNRADLMMDLKKAICVVMPSFFEACPMILLESMCMGKIPVLFDLPYSEELTENGEYGILARNVADMAMKINFLATQSDTRLLENKIRDFARSKYNVEKTCSEYIKLYKSVANNT